MVQVVSHPLTGGDQVVPHPPARRPGGRRRLVLTVLAVVAFVAAVLGLGLDGLIPFGVLLAFSADADEEATRRSVIVTPRNLGLATAMSAALAWFSLSYFDLTMSTLMVIAGVAMALPLALQESTGDATRESTVAVTKRSHILAVWGLVISVTSTTRGGRASADWRRCA